MFKAIEPIEPDIPQALVHMSNPPNLELRYITQQTCCMPQLQHGDVVAV
jgi:hypothetical protein